MLVPDKGATGEHCCYHYQFVMKVTGVELYSKIKIIQQCAIQAHVFKKKIASE